MHIPDSVVRHFRFRMLLGSVIALSGMVAMALLSVFQWPQTLGGLSRTSMVLSAVVLARISHSLCFSARKAGI